jgi:hypothetical protein
VHIHSGVSITKLKTNVFIWVIFHFSAAEFKIILQFRQSKYYSAFRTMALSEPAKLYLLVGCLLTCLCTLSRHQASVWALDPPVLHPTQYRRKSKQALRKCLDSMQHEGVPTSRKVAVQRSFTYRVAATIPLLTSILTWVDAPIRTKSFH